MDSLTDKTQMTKCIRGNLSIVVNDDGKVHNPDEFLNYSHNPSGLLPPHVIHFIIIGIVSIMFLRCLRPPKSDTIDCTCKR